MLFFRREDTHAWRGKVIQVKSNGLTQEARRGGVLELFVKMEHNTDTHVERRDLRWLAGCMHQRAYPYNSEPPTRLRFVKREAPTRFALNQDGCVCRCA